MTNTDRLAQATKLLRGMQSALGSSRPDDADEAEAWDEIDEVCTALASLAPAAVEGEPVAYLRTDLAPDGSNCGRELMWTHHDELWPERAAKGFSVRVDPLYSAAQVAALTAQCESLKREVSAVIDTMPGAVRVCEGGGPENLAMSLAVSANKLVRDAKRYRKARTMGLRPDTDSIVPIRPDKFDALIDAAGNGEGV